MAETKTLEIRTGRSRPVGIWHLFAGIIMAALGVYVWFNPVATMVHWRFISALFSLFSVPAT